jgi:aspartyl-tRNA(Asn)/glutamyl-tRNA(Gln) amidotransferase subunit B
VSVRRRGETKLGTKAEVKNLNSFRYLQRALEYEITRQVGVLEAGERIVQETRLWNVPAGRTEPMRSKEFAHDYRYFPDPDLLPVRVSAAQRAEIAAQMPELPAARRARFVSEYGVTPYDAGVLTDTSGLADYYEQTARAGAPPRLAAAWIQTELLRQRNQAGAGETSDAEFPVAPAEFASLLKMIDQEKITAAMGKKILPQMFGSGRSAAEIVAAEGFEKIDDTSEIERLCQDALAASPDNAAKLRAGNQGVFNFFVGQVMRASRGQANPQVVQDTLRRLLA